MPDLVFPGSGRYKDQLGEYIRSMFGYRVAQRGKDWVVSDRDPALRRGPRDTLKLHPIVSLHPKDHSAAAKKLSEHLLSDFDAYPQPSPTINVTGNLGYISRLEPILINLVAASSPDVEPLLRDELLPFMVEKMSATRVAPVTVDVTYQQSVISFAKVALLMEQFDVDKAWKLVRENDAYESILPSSFEAIGYLSSLTRSLPYAFTLEASRPGSALHFLNDDGFWVFPFGMTEGFFQRLMSGIDPMGIRPDLIGLGGLELVTRQNIARYLREATSGINRLINYSNDFRHFVSDDGRVDLAKQLQTFSAVRLVFADLAAMNSSSSAHSRIQFGMSLIDKLANLRRALGGHSSATEEALALELPSVSQGEQVRKIIEYRLKTHDSAFARAFSSAAIGSFEAVHAHLKSLYGAEIDEGTRLARLRSQRNVRHGTFLHRRQFDQLFQQSSGSVPHELAALPFWLTLALVFDPEQFLSFRPSVAN